MGIKVPLGLENFGKIREGGYYFIDKTAFIRELLSREFEANLITRPRRFGKTLTMSMLEDFFDISRDSRAHFEELEISKDTELCKEWMNQWPVIFLTMKSVEGMDFEGAYDSLKVLIADVCMKYAFLSESEKVDSTDKELFKELKGKKADKGDLKNSLVILTRMLHAHYGKPVILLIDEYDVPLAKASEGGYYAEMVDMIRSLLGNALKTNFYLKFAVVTGCLRISKESIFTGLNNLVVDDITGGGFQEYIGFTPDEVQQMLMDAGFSDHAEEVRAWYDGYRFGDAELYCPWSVLGHINALQANPGAKPKNYWANTSHNGIIYHFIDKKLRNIKSSFNTLMDGGMVITQIEENLTYDYLKSSVKNFWSLLYLTGYLTEAEPSALAEGIPEDCVALRIPNREVRKIFQDNIIDWFNDYVETIDRMEMCRALWDGDVETAQKLLSGLLFKTISYYDYRESFYHAFLAGLFAGDEYEVESNCEYGTGRPDIVVKDDENERALIMEIKYARTEDEIPLKREEAVKQFAEREYLEGIEEGYTTRIGYAVVFYRKKCFIAVVEQT